jgi:hypothetical protein
MATVRRTPPPPRSRRTYDDDQRGITTEMDRLARAKSNPPRPVPLVKVTPEADESWPPGTAWLDTSVDV